MIPIEFIEYVNGYNEQREYEEHLHQRRTAQLSAVIANSAFGTKKHFRIDDFMPRKKAIGTEEMLNEVKRINALFGGNQERKTI